MLYELVSTCREPLLRHMREVDPNGYGLPRHIDRELEAYLRCGVLAYGFVRVRCGECHDELIVGYSCKTRGLCPSCTARRMADTAANLVDRLLPEARYRQWVFTVPKSLRLCLAREPAWASWVNQLIVRAIRVWQRRQARGLGVHNGQTGAVSFVQRFGGLLNLNVHYHLVVPDGVFVADEATGELSLVRLSGPTADDLLAILDRVADRINERLAEARDHRDAADKDVDTPPDLYSQLQFEAATTWKAPPRPSSISRGTEPGRAWSAGFSLHAQVKIAGTDRAALERLCRYGARPAFAQARLSWTDDGRVSYRLKRPWPDGRAELVLEPQAMLRRLCGIIPPPRRHLVRYSGIFGPAAADRKRLRSLLPATATAATTCALPLPPDPTRPPSSVWRARRTPWAELLRRVFADHLLHCACGGRRTVLAMVTDPNTARALLDRLGLPHRPPVFAPRGPPELFDDPSPASQPDPPAPNE